MYKLVIANRNYSSWSLRAWLYLTESKVPFEEIRIPLFTDNWQSEIARFSPAGRVPVLLDDDITVWDSTAIIEYVRNKHPDAVGWPELPRVRAHALSIIPDFSQYATSFLRIYVPDKSSSWINSRIRAASRLPGLMRYGQIVAVDTVIPVIGCLASSRLRTLFSHRSRYDL